MEQIHPPAPLSIGRAAQLFAGTHGSAGTGDKRGDGPHLCDPSAPFPDVLQN